MANLTRDPFHKQTGTYIKNMGQMNVWVNNIKLDSQFVLNVYTTAHGRAPYVQVFTTNSSGKIVETQVLEGAPRPVIEDIEGVIEVTGNPFHCGCWERRRIAHWWRKLYQYGKGNGKVTW